MPIDVRQLCVELQCLGVNVPEGVPARTGGAGPSEGTTLVIAERYISVPASSWYVRESPYRLQVNEGCCVLYKNGLQVCPVSIPDVPRYYSCSTASGVPLEKIALLHGRDCLASTVYQHCVYRDSSTHCRFCGIGISLYGGRTVLHKQPDDLAKAAEIAAKLDGAAHVTLTTGCSGESSKNIVNMACCVENIKKSSKLPVHVQLCPPDDLILLDMLRDSGADTAGIHIETCDMGLLKKIAPAKAAFGLDRYVAAWEHAVALFGRNQVSTFLLAGIGESAGGIEKDAALLARIGVVPFVVPLRPLEGTELGSSRPPDPAEMMKHYERTAEIMRKEGLSTEASLAGCVRCGACSALSLFV